MGRVNWNEAQKYYMSGAHVSYSMVAQRYGVSKSTAQSYGTRHDWKNIRQAIFDRKVELLIHERALELAEIEKGQLKKSMFIQSVALSNMNHFVKQMNEGKYEDHYSREILSSVRTLKVGMDLEAAILGLTRHKIYQKVEADQGNKEYFRLENPEQISSSFEELIKAAEKRLAQLKRRKVLFERGHQISMDK